MTSFRRILSSIALAIVLTAASFGAALPVTAQETIQLIEPTLSVPIPNLRFSETKVINSSSGDFEDVRIPWIANYIQGVYDYAIGIAAVLAAAMMMIGGFQYLVAGGDSGKVSEAKKRITDALVGLVLALGAYVILTTVSGNLVNLPDIRLQMLERIPYVVEEGGDTDDDGNPSAIPATEVYCPKSGGSAAIPQIIESLKNKVTYRFGGKFGKQPPYSEKPEKADYYALNHFCPENTLCLDCSGFVVYVLRCAGLPGLTGGTGNILKGSNIEMVTSYDIDKRTVNEKELEPGDLIGYIGEESKKTGVGHVLLYIGEGRFAESHGGISGRQPGANPRITAMNKSLMDHITRIRRN